MTIDLLQGQAAQRQKYLDAILNSSSPRRLIVAGPGTGKTYTFGQLLRKSGKGDKLALTFIRKLVMDMESEFGELAEVKTFHAYCKKLLHQKRGGIELFPFLTQVIEEDATLLDLALSDFKDAFQTLDEQSNEIEFYLERGDYYNAVSFDDSVYRVYKAVQEDARFLPQYTQIVIDEFQDFNPLEVSFIDELQKHGPILIVGDDDQAVYRLRNSTPVYLREKFQSGEYELFELPFCSRCPRVAVDATSSFIDAVVAAGRFDSRVDRPFIPFLEDKEYENQAYPKIISATTSNIACLAKLIRIGIQNIPDRDIAEAHEEGYPCVLIVGQRQYLNPLNKSLSKHYASIAFTQAEGRAYSILDGYDILRNQEDSNLGWRLLAGIELPEGQLREVVQSSQDHTPLKHLLPQDFVDKHSLILEILRKQEIDDADQESLINLLGDQSRIVIDHFYGLEEEEEAEPDRTQPAILMSSFQGCKGLSAGHVFIVGLNNGSMPRIAPDGGVADIEISKFIAAMTRTRKLLYLLSNRWDYGPKGPRFDTSMFMEMIPAEFQIEGGYVKSKGVEALMKTAWEIN